MIIPQNLYGIIGWPLGHSLSPLLHNTAFQTLGLPCAYFSWPIPPDRLANFIQAFKLLKIMGCSITIPHKIAILPLLDSISEPAKQAGAVNTLVWRNNGLHGENTDIAGFLAPLKNIAVEKMNILLLGAGGAARAVAVGLFLRHCKNVIVTSPGDKRQFPLAEEFGFEAIPWNQREQRDCNFIINATPMGMSGKLMDECPYNFTAAPGSIAYDLVYNPLETKFLETAANHGWTTISGLEMFYWQADAQFRLWTGLELPETSRQALENALK